MQLGAESTFEGGGDKLELYANFVAAQHSLQKTNDPQKILPSFCRHSDRRNCQSLHEPIRTQQTIQSDQSRSNAGIVRQEKIGHFGFGTLQQLGMAHQRTTIPLSTSGNGNRYANDQQVLG